VPVARATEVVPNARLTQGTGKSLLAAPTTRQDQPMGDRAAVSRDGALGIRGVSPNLWVRWALPPPRGAATALDQGRCPALRLLRSANPWTPSRDAPLT
jgi:hypothetical protein